MLCGPRNRNGPVREKAHYRAGPTADFALRAAA
jgi:hypothetical protein